MEETKRLHDFKYLTDAHTRHMIVRYHIEGYKPAQIFSELTDPEAPTKFGFEPAEGLTIVYLYRRIHEIPNTTIEMIKVEWREDLLAEPLANKRVRIRELASMYAKERKASEKRHILKAIKEEVGEEKWRDVMKGSGSKNSNITPQMLRNVVADILGESADEL